MEEVLIEKFVFKNTTFRLKEPVKCKYEQSEHFHIYELPEYNLDAWDKDKEKAFEIFNEQFYMHYKIYTNKTNDELTQDAIDLRNAIVSNIESIERRNNNGRLKFYK